MEIGESRFSHLFSKDTIQIDYANSIVVFNVSDDAVSLGVFNDVTNELEYAERYSLAEKVDREFSVPFDKELPSRIIITKNTGRFTLIPHQFESVSDDSLASFLRCNSVELHKHRLDELDASLIFKQDASFQWLTSMFPAAEIKHSAAVTIENALIRNRYQKGIKLYADITESSVDLVLFSDNQLVTVLSENYTTSSDLLYLITSKLESSGFDQLSDMLYLSGLVNSKDDLYIELSRFVKEIRLHTGFKFQKVHAQLGIIPKHLFFNVINAYQCA